MHVAQSEARFQELTPEEMHDLDGGGVPFWAVALGVAVDFVVGVVEGIHQHDEGR